MRGLQRSREIRHLPARLISASTLLQKKIIPFLTFALLAGCTTASSSTTVIHASEKNRFEVVDCMIDYWPVAGPQIESTANTDILTSEAGATGNGISAATRDSDEGSVTELRNSDPAKYSLTVLDQCF